MDTKLKGKVAIVTGASSGIGAASARQLAAEGAAVVLTGRRRDHLEQVAQEILTASGAAAVLPGDMADEDFCRRLVQFAADTFQRVDILVCSAGMALRAPSLEMTTQEWQKVMDVNLTAPMVLSQACIRHFQQEGGGKIVYISSTAGKNVNMGASPSYGASKAGLLYLTRHFGPHLRQCCLPGSGGLRDHPHLDPGAQGQRAAGPAHGPHGHAGGHRQRGGVPGQLPERLHHRGGPADQRRTVYGLR